MKRSTGIVRARTVQINGPSTLRFDAGAKCASAWVEVADGIEVVLG